VKCWNCQTEAADTDVCPACGKVQPLAKGATLFDVLGLPRGVEVETGPLERAYRERSLRVHPDRVGKDDGRERRLALERTALLNEAYRTLKAPEPRAFYLLKLHGLDLLKDEARTLPVPPALLEEALELREQLDDAQRRGDEETVTALSDRVRTRAATALSAAQSALRRLERVPDDAAARTEAGAALARLRYHRRFLEAVDADDQEDL
jgi:molecular chaperone HscB